MPNVHTKESRELGNIKQQLRSGKTRSKNPRELTPDEVRAFELRRDALRLQMKDAAGKRLMLRINSHTSAVVASEVHGAKGEILAAVDAAKSEIVTAMASQPPQQQPPDRSESEIADVMLRAQYFMKSDL